MSRLRAPTSSHCLLILATIMLLVSTARADSPDCDGSPSPLDNTFLTVGTLNMAHGRKDAHNQMFLSEERIRQNLAELATLLDRANADVIALQEVDAPSWWSGKFNHAEFLARQSRYHCLVHGIHASNRIYRFGTALISPHPLQGQQVHSFQPSWPTTTKGFTRAELAWNPGGRLDQPLKLTFVSVHLDFSRRSVRRAQIDEMTRALENTEGPMILMGDFNTDWLSEGSSLKLLAENLGLRAYEPHAEGMATYGDESARLDWILVSPRLRFRRYAVYPDVVSDHYAVAAEIEWAEKP